MSKYKILEEWFEVDSSTGLFVRYAEINPEHGGKSKIIKLTVDNGIPFNTLSNGYHEVKKGVKNERKIN